MVIRHLELALLPLIQQLELMNAVQCMIVCKLPVNLINPTLLYNILRNVSLHLIAGTRAENIHLYYELMEVAAIETFTVLNRL